MDYFLGVDVGSVNSELVLIDENSKIVQLDTERISSGPRTAVNSLIARLSERFALERIIGAGVSGSGRAVIPKELDWLECSSSLSIAAGLLHCYPEAKTIIQIGGQSSLIIELEDGLRKPWKVASNSLCAAGTGRFLEQQAYRIGISMDDFSNRALQCEGSPPRIAARCSVFAKTDLIHLQQKGVSVEAMLYALCESVARMVASLKKGTFEMPVYLVGGVAANVAIVKALNDVLSARNKHRVQITVPENYLYIEALGAALLSKEKTSKVIVLPETGDRQRYFEMPQLEIVPSQDSKPLQKIEEECTGYLGVDIGSTSTKAVIVDESGKRVIGKNYLMTAGRPIDAIKEVFRNLLKDGGDKVKIAGVGITGSGRYMVGSFIGADLIKNEITAQTRAAAEIDSEADIIEIGGQDSKLVIKRNGVVVDYQMNKACAAGTGSFIDELAEMLGVSVTNGEFADLAFAAPYTIDLGTRCAAFMGQAVSSAQQEGVPLEIITASLANSIAKNYLSKVVANRKLGNKVILTGAVFYNQAVVSAFHKQLEGKSLTVLEHKEISGAIGAALLAKEQMVGRESKFSGFQKVVDSEYTLSTFTCKGCDNNCTITRMQMPNGETSYYGSRCDRYDSIASHAKKETFFDKRGKLLFREYREGSGTGPSVGIPRALLVYDFAPLLIGFLNALDVKCVLSRQTNKEIVERAIELSYTDGCFPLKLLHGHAAMLNDVDYVLYPSAIRLGEKDGDENQKYACPLVQASPYIIRQTVNLGKRLLIPTLDFSRGDADVIRNLTDVARKMGFSRSRARKAALVGIESQRKFEVDQAALGSELLQQLHQSNQLGVVLFARSYMSQDAGANLGIAEKLAQLGVVPIPLDFLPLSSVDPKKYSDRPYWFYESKYIAGAATTVSDPQLYGLVLTNFGCGPNSFILPIVEDIMGSKPLGQLEIDEHAAEAGIVTRLEAFVDTIEGFSRSTTQHEVPRCEAIYRRVPTLQKSQKILLLPNMSVHAEIIGKAMEVYGARTIVLPEPDKRNLLYSDRVTSGVECLPYRVTLGDFLRFHYENGTGSLKNVVGFMPGAYGPCRFGKYAGEQIRTLKDLDIDLPLLTTVSNNGYTDTDIGKNAIRFAWRCCVAADYLQKLLWRTRPYEKRVGETDVLFDDYTHRIANHIHLGEGFDDLLRRATADFKALIDPELPRKPLVGINGEFYIRSNRFSNNDLVRKCEDAGLEVIVSPVSEWLKYIMYRYIEDAIRERDLKKMINGYIMKRFQDRDECLVANLFSDLLDDKEPSAAHILAQSGRWVSQKCGSEAVVSIGAGIDCMENPKFAGVISVMPHGCMPGGIVAAMSEKFSALYQKPWINLTYDGLMEANNSEKVNNFAEIIKFCSKGK
ncbi:MAG: acyl-CoA dehydratase activase [Chloroflexota bacterium]|nr:acyl-CoA dehydratase activase [Chloroflexota bacterium]